MIDVLLDIMKTEFKKLFDRIEIYLIITGTLVISFLSIIDFCINEGWFASSYIASAWQTSLIYGGTFGELFSIIFIPLMAVLPFSDQYTREREYGCVNVVISRRSRNSYFFQKAFLVVSVSMLSVLLAYIFNQICAFIAFPNEQVKGMLDGSIYRRYLEVEIQHTSMPSLWMNDLRMMNLIHMVFASAYAGGIAVFGYMLSLYMNLNRTLTNIIPVVVTFLLAFLGLTLLGADYSPAVCIIVRPTYTTHSFLIPLLIVVSTYIISLVGITLRSYVFKDML
jgi:hypothetical protein